MTGTKYQYKQPFALSLDVFYIMLLYKEKHVIVHFLHKYHINENMITAFKLDKHINVCIIYV